MHRASPSPAVRPQAMNAVQRKGLTKLPMSDVPQPTARKPSASWDAGRGRFRRGHGNLRIVCICNGRLLSRPSLLVVVYQHLFSTSLRLPDSVADTPSRFTRSIWTFGLWYSALRGQGAVAGKGGSGVPAEQAQRRLAARTPSLREVLRHSDMRDKIENPFRAE